MNIHDLHKRASQKKPENEAFFRKLAKWDPRKLDERVHQLHDEVFDEIDCLECGNCCKSLGPRITTQDIEKIASSLKVKPGTVMQTYFREDEDGDFVFKSMPCPFLGAGNYCSIYDKRPKACREYPHTDRRRFYQLLPITLKNSFVCPAVYEIIERLKAGT
jgi:Fe-S-cluster containining protein